MTLWAGFRGNCGAVNSIKENIEIREIKTLIGGDETQNVLGIIEQITLTFDLLVLCKEVREPLT